MSWVPRPRQVVGGVGRDIMVFPPPPPPLLTYLLTSDDEHNKSQFVPC